MTHARHPAADVIDAFGGASALARLLGESPPQVWNWKTRGIPVQFWRRIIAEAAVRSLPGISAESLLDMHQPATPPSPPPPGTASTA